MPAEVIDRIHVLGRRSAADLTFLDRNRAIIPDDDADDNAEIDPAYAPNEDEASEEEELNSDEEVDF